MKKYLESQLFSHKKINFKFGKDFLFKSITASISLALCQPLAYGENTTSSSTTKSTRINVKAEKTKTRPNVLVLLFDDLRFDTFSYRGGPVPTPNIDELAAQSTRFDTAITTTGLCSPSRAALFTGRWGHRTGLDDNVELWHSRLQELSTSEGGLIKRASDAGYFVGYVGKWHLGANGPAKRGAQFVGAFEADSHEAVRQMTPYNTAQAVEGYKAGKRDANGEKHEYFQTLANRYEDTTDYKKVVAGQEFIRKASKKGQPFFGVVSFTQPHPPYRVPEPFASMFDPNTLELPANHLAKRVGTPLSQEYPYWPWHDVSHMTESDWRKARAHYYGAVAMVDRMVGELIQSAKEAGVWDDLHVVLLGDQGSMVGEHGLYDKAAYAYDELMRIPLLVRNPKLSPKVVSRHVSLLDIPVTMAEWMQLKPDGPTDGHSLTPLMRQGDSALTADKDQAIYAYEWYNGAWFGLRAIRTSTAKYVWNQADSRDELYDLTQDPGEMVNQINNPAYRKTLIELREKLLKEMQRTEDPSSKRLKQLMLARSHDK